MCVCFLFWWGRRGRGCVCVCVGGGGLLTSTTIKVLPSSQFLISCHCDKRNFANEWSIVTSKQLLQWMCVTHHRHVHAYLHMRRYITLRCQTWQFFNDALEKILRESWKDWRNMSDIHVQEDNKTAVLKKQDYLNLVTRKPIFGVCDLGRLKPACAATEAS